MDCLPALANARDLADWLGIGQVRNTTASGGTSTQIKYLSKVQIRIINITPVKVKVLLFQFYSSEKYKSTQFFMYLDKKY